MKERLQKILSAAGVCSRRKAEELITQGRVTVNGETARVGQKLGDSMALFEEGTKLVNACRKELDTAEQKVVKLSKGPDDAPVEHDFAAED